MDIKTREARARRAAKKQGYIIRKSRARNWKHYDQQGYMILDPYSNGIYSGSNFDMSLEDVEAWLGEDVEKAGA